MRIGIDTNGIIVSKNRGIGNYTIELCKALFMLYPENEFYFLTWGDESIQKRYFSSFDNVDEYIAGNDLNMSRAVMRQSIKNFINAYQLDVYYVSHPIAANMPIYDKRWFGKVILACTIHDITAYLFKERAFGNVNIYSGYVERMLNLRQFDVIFTNSECTKNDVVRHLGIKEEHVENIYMDGCTDMEAPKEQDRDINPEWKKKFYLNVAGDYYNKNVKNLVRGYGIAASKNLEIPDLFLVGRKSPYFDKSVKRIAFQYKVMDKVFLLGQVSDAQLSFLYQNAQWLLFPSLYEGFGMPVLEAWNHGVPVLTSQNSSLGEIAKGAAMLVDPLDVQDIAEKICRIVDMSAEERETYIQAGVSRRKDFSWKKTAKAFYERLEAEKQTRFCRVKYYVINITNFFRKKKERRCFREMLQ